jgi:hypothetical protein
MIPRWLSLARVCRRKKSAGRNAIIFSDRGILSHRIPDSIIAIFHPVWYPVVR